MSDWNREKTSLARRWGIALLLIVVALMGAAGLMIYAGAYNIGADAPHTDPVFRLMNLVRQRSITVRAAGISALEWARN